MAGKLIRDGILVLVLGFYSILVHPIMISYIPLYVYPYLPSDLFKYFGISAVIIPGFLGGIVSGCLLGLVPRYFAQQHAFAISLLSTVPWVILVIYLQWLLFSPFSIFGILTVISDVAWLIFSICVFSILGLKLWSKYEKKSEKGDGGNKN